MMHYAPFMSLKVYQQEHICSHRAVVSADLPNWCSNLHVSLSLFFNHSASISSLSILLWSMNLTFLSMTSLLVAIAPDFSQNPLKAQTLARQGGDVLIECKPRMSPRGVISWRKGKEALRESHRYQVTFYAAAGSVFLLYLQCRISKPLFFALL